MSPTQSRPLLAVAAMMVGLSAIPVAAHGHWVISMALLALPIFMVHYAG